MSKDLEDPEGAGVTLYAAHGQGPLLVLEAWTEEPATASVTVTDKPTSWSVDPVGVAHTEVSCPGPGRLLATARSDNGVCTTERAIEVHLVGLEGPRFVASGDAIEVTPLPVGDAWPTRHEWVLEGYEGSPPIDTGLSPTLTWVAIEHFMDLYGTGAWTRGEAGEDTPQEIVATWTTTVYEVVFDQPAPGSLFNVGEEVEWWAHVEPAASLGGATVTWWFEYLEPDRGDPGEGVADGALARRFPSTLVREGLAVVEASAKVTEGDPSGGDPNYNQHGGFAKLGTQATNEAEARGPDYFTMTLNYPADPGASSRFHHEQYSRDFRRADLRALGLPGQPPNGDFTAGLSYQEGAEIELVIGREPPAAFPFFISNPAADYDAGRPIEEQIVLPDGWSFSQLHPSTPSHLYILPDEPEEFSVYARVKYTQTPHPEYGWYVYRRIQTGIMWDTTVDPCTGTPRLGVWHITTYYTAVEGPVPSGVRDEPMQLRDGTTVHVNPGFRGRVRIEGWGRLGPEHPQYPGQYIGNPRRNTSAPGGHDFVLAATGGGRDRHGNPLVPYVSLATDQGYNWETGEFDGVPVIADGKHAGFYMVPGNGWPWAPACGLSVDIGPEIEGNDIDFYVGEWVFEESGAPDRYRPQETDGAASVEP